jgi:peptide chain release factor subunit 1
VVAITEDDIRSLASFKGEDAPVTSVYLDVDGGRHVRFQDVVRSAEMLFKEALHKHDGHPSVAADIQRVQELVRGGIDRSKTRGIAVFSCSAHDFWRVVELPVPVRDQVVVNHTPSVRQLEVVVDEYERFGLLLADKQRARVFVYELGEVVESTELVDSIGRGDDEGDHSRRRERVKDHESALVHQHLRHAADAAFRVFQDRGFERLIIGAPDEIASELRTLLHPYLQERLEAHCTNIAVGASMEEIRQAALAVEAEVERRKEAELVARLRESAGAGRRAVLGLEATLQALVERRVETLVVSHGYAHPGWRCAACGHVCAKCAVGRTCPACEREMHAVDDVVEEAVEDALGQSCEVEICVGNADLDVLGSIGALLRY